MTAYPHSPWMAILNLSFDSFSGDGLDEAGLRSRLESLKVEDFSFLDFGAISTRPGSEALPPEREWARLAPALPILRNFSQSRKSTGRPVRLSLDTSSPTVARLALAELPEISLINDVYAGRKTEEGLTTLHVAAEAKTGLVLMHMQNEPANMQERPHYTNCLEEVLSFLKERHTLAREAGVEELYLDPGIGFGKRYEDNLALLSPSALHAYASLSRSLGETTGLMIGLSRKSFLGEWIRRKHGEGADEGPESRDAISKIWERRCLAGIQSLEREGLTVPLYLRSHRLPSEVLINPTDLESYAE